ncbi:apolipoprotein D-like [Babylonia areolata]|uniref:apolipoprotein D-like n=1 Tax=Babylonia areolata TaxID=304850 RepID=UPI003FD02865
MTVLAVALTVCGYVSLASSQVIGFGPCPNKLQAQSSLNVTKYLGQWLEIYAFPASFESGQRCVTANYTLKGNGHIMVNNQGYKDGEYLNAVGDAYCPNASKPAELIVRFSDGAPQASYWVIETDYENYSLVFSCRPVLNAGHEEFAWILSRWPQLDPPTVSHLQGLLKAAGVNVGHFREMDQSECPGRGPPGVELFV